MGLFRILGEIALFRWLFHSHESHNSNTPPADSCQHNHDEYGAGSKNFNDKSYDDFLDEQEEYDMMDDLF